MIVVFDLVDFALGLVDDHGFFVRDHNVGDRNGQTAARSGGESDFLELVKEFDRLGQTGFAEAVGDHLTQALLAEHLIHVSHLNRHDLIEQDASGRGLNVLTIDTHLDLGVHRGSAVVEGDDHFFHRAVDLAFTLGTVAGLGEVVDAEDHVLRRYGDRLTVLRVHDVVA